MADTRPVPNTISDDKWKRLQQNARRANPGRDSVTDPKAIKARINARKQYLNRGMN